MSLSQTETDLLKQLVDVTNDGKALYLSAEQVANLKAQGLVEGNPAMVDPTNLANMAYRASAHAASYLQNLTAATAPAPTVGTPAKSPALQFDIGHGFVAPTKVQRRASGNNRTYPFDKMGVGDFIFVGATEKKPNPKASLASTISAANKRGKEFNPQRFYRTYRAKAGQMFGNIVAPSDGVYIVRENPPVEAPAVSEAPAA